MLFDIRREAPQPHSLLHCQLGHVAGLLEDMYALSPSDLALKHKRYLDLDIILALVHRADFKIDKTEGLFLKPFIIAQPGSLNLSFAVWESLVNIVSNYPEISNAIYPEVTA